MGAIICFVNTLNILLTSAGTKFHFIGNDFKCSSRQYRSIRHRREYFMVRFFSYIRAEN